MNRRFPRAARVRARSEFDRIFKHGRRVALPVLALHWLAEPPAEPAGPAGASLPAVETATAAAAADPRAPTGVARLGLAVSRKVDPHAVGRNRIKRQLRECFREHRGALAPGDYVAVARPGAAALAPAALRAALLGLLRRAGAFDPALPLVAPPGTMPAAACTERVQPPSR